MLKRPNPILLFILLLVGSALLWGGPALSQEPPLPCQEVTGSTSPVTKKEITNKAAYKTTAPYDCQGNLIAEGVTFQNLLENPDDPPDIDDCSTLITQMGSLGEICTRDPAQYPEDPGKYCYKVTNAGPQGGCFTLADPCTSADRATVTCPNTITSCSNTIYGSCLNRGCCYVTSIWSGVQWVNAYECRRCTSFDAPKIVCGTAYPVDSPYDRRNNNNIDKCCDSGKLVLK